MVADGSVTGVRRVGRFRWSGSSATVVQQIAEALNADMGLNSSVVLKHVCGRATSGVDCRTADAKGPDLSDSDLALLVRYTSLLEVPPARHFCR